MDGRISVLSSQLLPSKGHHCPRLSSPKFLTHRSTERSLNHAWRHIAPFAIHPTQSGVRATARLPISILQARGGGAFPEVALSTIERFVAVTSTPAVELPEMVE